MFIAVDNILSSNEPCRKKNGLFRQTFPQISLSARIPAQRAHDIYILSY